MEKEKGKNIIWKTDSNSEEELGEPLDDEKPDLFNKTLNFQKTKTTTMTNLKTLETQKTTQKKRRKTCQRATSIPFTPINTIKKIEKRSFGPKSYSSLPKSKEEISEDLPIESENHDIFKRMGISKNSLIQFISHSEARSTSYKFSLNVIYNTNNSSIAKNEDDFWRYEREHKIMDADIQNIFNVRKEGDGFRRRTHKKTTVLKNENFLSSIVEADESHIESTPVIHSILKLSGKYDEFSPNIPINSDDSLLKTVNFSKRYILPYCVKSKPKNLLKKKPSYNEEVEG